MKPIFADTGYFLALSQPRHDYHMAARSFAVTNRRRIVTSTAVAFELGAALADVAHRQFFVMLAQILKQDAVELVAIDGPLYDAAVERFGARLDQELSLADCSSFLIMERRGLTDVVATDSDFAQAGFHNVLDDIRKQSGKN